MSGEALARRLEEVQRRAARGMDFGLERMRAALAALGDPQDAVPSVHVAGTNGKGSTSAMIESIARAAGLKTGLYTSPHLCRIAERIRIAGEPIDDVAFDAALAAVLADDSAHLTFFETLTAAAFVAFRDAAVDLAVVEVGLGGRLDATNTMRAPLVTVITSIDFDHTDLLGHTLAEIAREKAGIARRAVPLVVGPVGDDAFAAIEETARAAGAGPIVRLDGGGTFFETALEGEHQRDNARVAAATIRALEARFPGISKAIEPGLSRVRWPGRFERLRRGEVEIILDCAHNVHGARALAAALANAGIAPERTTLVFGALADKDFAAMLAELAPVAARRVYTRPSGRAPAPYEALLAIAPGVSVDAPAEALDRAVTAAAPGDCVVVTGSSYLVGEIRARHFGIDADPVIAL